MAPDTESRTMIGLGPNDSMIALPIHNPLNHVLGFPVGHPVICVIRSGHSHIEMFDGTRTLVIGDACPKGGDHDPQLHKDGTDYHCSKCGQYLGEAR